MNPIEGRILNCITPLLVPRSGLVDLVRYPVAGSCGRLRTPVEIVCIGACKMDSSMRFHQMRPELIQLTDGEGAPLASGRKSLLCPVSADGKLNGVFFSRIYFAKCGQGALS